MKFCAKCDQPFDTPGIQCQSCRDNVTKISSNPLLDSSMLSLPGIDPLTNALLLINMAKNRKEKDPNAIIKTEK